MNTTTAPALNIDPEQFTQGEVMIAQQWIDGIHRAGPSYPARILGDWATHYNALGRAGWVVTHRPTGMRANAQPLENEAQAMRLALMLHQADHQFPACKLSFAVRPPRKWAEVAQQIWNEFKRREEAERAAEKARARALSPTMAERTEKVIEEAQGEMEEGFTRIAIEGLEAHARQLAARLDQVWAHLNRIEGGLWYEDGTDAAPILDEIRAIMESKS